MSDAEFEEIARQAKADADAGRTPAGENDKIELVRLAGLTTFEYDRERKAAAERLGVRPATLDECVKYHRREREIDGDVRTPEIEPWPDPVDGAAMLEEIAQAVNRHVVVSTCAENTVALWTAHAHALQAAYVTPILAITSPAPECGKSTMLSLIGALVPGALAASNITPAATFRAIDKWQPTLLIDEADTFLPGNDEMRGIINSGHTRGTARVIRTVGDDHEPRHFSTWCPKVIAMIGGLAPTLASRSIKIEMQRKKAGEKVEALRLLRSNSYIDLARKLARWAVDNNDALGKADPIPPEDFGNRRADNWQPLFAIADQAGGDWPRWAREAALALDKPDAGQTTGIMLLSDLRDLFAQNDTDRLMTADILAALAERMDRPWPEYGRTAKPITARQLAKLLAPFGISPRTIRDGGVTAKGYDLAACTEAFSGYLSPSS